MRARVPVLLLLLIPGCASIRGMLASDIPSWADQVTITRDEWGVPHVAGETDAATVFGMAIAQAEDNFWQLEEDVLRALGRAANLYGESQIAGDLVRAAFEVERRAREEYDREPPERRVLWDAWAAGINHYLAMHPDVRPRLLWRFEPWYVFALTRSLPPGLVVDGVRLGDPAGLDDALPGGAVAVAAFDSAARAETGAEAAEGSVAWAIAPGRTVDGHPLLHQAVHGAFFGAGQNYEAHLRSAEGWHVTGIAMLGTPIIRSGHTEHHAWAHTAGGGDTRDAYVLRFDHPSDALAYRWGAEWRVAEPFTVNIAVNTTTGVEQRTFTFLRAHIGPVVARQGSDCCIAVRLARMDEGGALQQWYGMSRATSNEEFHAALAQTALVGLNTLYADTAGNIGYVHGSAVPRRAPGVDPSRLLDGTDASTAWDEYHSLAELPQLHNPGSGWLQSTGASPFLATAAGYNLDRASYPTYMAPEPDDSRSRRSRELLAADTAWTFDELGRVAFDMRMAAAADWIPRLIDEYERRGALDPSGALALDATIEMLRAWDASAGVDSPETTLVVMWLERVHRPYGQEGRWPLTSALEWTLAHLEQQWGTDSVPWGDVHRLQRIHTSGNEHFDDDLPSLPVGGAPSWTGSIFGLNTRTAPGARRRYATAGSAWMEVVELTRPVRSRAIVPLGQSADPGSPHFFDQAPLYVDGRFRDAAFETGIPELP